MSDYNRTWFILSYDATEELYEVYGEFFSGKDFREQIIWLLRTRKVIRMYEYVETTIHFLDHKLDLTDLEKLKYWEETFKDISTDFKFIIGPLHSYTNDEPVIKHRKNTELNDNFQKLKRKVLLKEYKARAKRK